MSNNINWGNRPNNEFNWIMVGIVGVCLIGFLCSIFTEVENVITKLLVCIGVGAIIWLVAHYLRERRLDWEAFYGPLDEKDEGNQ
jgi:purine-cytosine permease-like protein